MLKLFARLKELSTKLVPSAAKKPENRLLTGTAEPAQPSTSVNIPGANIRVKATAAEISGNVETPSNAGALVPQTTAVATSPIRRIGSIVASPFRGPKPLHKSKLFWAGSGLGLGGLALGGAWLFVDNSVSQYKATDALNYVRPGTVTIKALNGSVLLQAGGDATRETLKLWQMPTNLKNAFVAIEDRRFYEHDGVDYKGVTRAMMTNLTSKHVVEGASSINQQLARMVYLEPERKDFWRKLREIRLAQRLGKELSKDRVLERYLNLVYLGEGTFGVSDAARVYFSKPVDELTLAEMATLAAMPPSPNKYSPFVNPDFAGKRRNLVLDRMADAKFITAAEAATAKAEPLKPNRSPKPKEEQQARYFTKYIEQELPQRITAKQIKTGGLIIDTTLNPDWQKKAEEVVNTTVRQNRGSFGQAAMVSVDPRTGGIRSMVGGTDFAKNQFNRVTQAKRQPGSTFKPFVYSTAIAGGISPNKTYLDAPVEIGLDEGGHYNPKNAGKSFKGPISMRDALVNSVNIVAIKVLIDAGYQPVIDMAHKMGVQSELKPVYALALGALEVNLLEMTSAYTTFANKGIHNPVHGITRVTNSKGEILYENKPNPERVLEPDTTAIMTWMMRGVVNEGTARSAQIGRPVAGKTGTTDKERDLWFIGFIPQLVTGVWLGNDNNQPTGNASSTAAYAWSRFMTTAVKNIPAQDFLPRPDDVDKRKPELKLDPVHPRYQRTLAAPAKDDKNGEESNSQDGSRRSRRSRRSESADNSTSDSPRRSRRSRRSESADNSTSDSPRRSRRSRRSESVPSSSDQ